MRKSTYSANQDFQLLKCMQIPVIYAFHADYTCPLVLVLGSIEAENIESGVRGPGGHLRSDIQVSVWREFIFGWMHLTDKLPQESMFLFLDPAHIPSPMINKKFA